jgi:hypothetical protein
LLSTSADEALHWVKLEEGKKYQREEAKAGKKEKVLL